MRRLVTVVAVFAVLAWAGGASAEKFEFTGLHGVKFSNLGQIDVTATGTGVATVNGSGGLGHLNTLQIGVDYAPVDGVAPVTDPIVTAGGIVEVRLTSVRALPSLQGGVFGNISGALGNTTQALSPNTMPGGGMVRICLFYTGCNSGALVQTLTATNGTGAYVGGGVGGVVTIGGAGAIRISIVGGPYTIKTATVFNRTNNGVIETVTGMGFAHGPASLTSSTAVTGGVVQVVNPSRTFVVGVPGNGDIAGQIIRYRLSFTPEPGMLILLGAGGVGLVLLGRKRFKK